MLDSRFFENTRLELMVKPLFVTDEDQKLEYANKAFRAFVKRPRITSTYKPDICDKERAEDGFKLYSLRSGTRVKDFYAIGVKVFGELPVIYLDKGIRNRSFPIVCDEQLFIGIDTFSERLLVPLFGGRIRKSLPPDGGGSTEMLPHAVEGASDFGIKCLCLGPVLESVIKSMSQRVAVGGFRVDSEIGEHSNPVCELNIFDISVISELLMMVMLKSSDERTVSVSLEESDDACRIVFAASGGDFQRLGNLRPGDVFDSDESCGRVIESVMELCELYSWKLMCRVNKNDFALALSLPICNSRTLKFANETDRSYEDVINFVTSILADDIDHIINEK